MTIGDLIRPDTPVALALAAVLAVAAAWIGRRAFASQQRQGRRLGAVEQLLKSERIRRRQVEQCLREQGFDLPYWPEDPAELHGVTAQRRSYAPYSGPGPWPEDGVPLPDDGDGPQTAQADAVYPPIPPLSPDERDRFSRHRR